MKRIIKKQVQVAAKVIDYRSFLVCAVGIATFFFGFFAGALFNLYLIAIKSPIVSQLRTTLTFQSAILGDGILLPLVNMIVASFLLKHAYLISKNSIRLSILIGVCITAYFHITQATQGLINWAMPTPWHWNLLGLWHGVYMLAVTSFLSLFYLVLLRLVSKQKQLSKEAILVTLGILLFFILLRLDYLSVQIVSLLCCKH